MTNKEAIVIISELIEFYESENLKEAFRLAVNALKEKPQCEWISVKDRLPKLFEEVLVTDELGIVFEYERRPSGDYDVNTHREWRFLGRNIIAWMPLPEAYKEAENE